MNYVLELNLRPKLTKFLDHVKTDPGKDPESWVQKAFELSAPVYEFLQNSMLAGFSLYGDQRPLEKVLDTFVRCKAKEEEQLGECEESFHVGITYCQLSRPSFPDSSRTLIQKPPEYD
jgi:hypothetical protein